MQKIPIKYAQAGMKLAKDALSADNKVLCGAGVTLTDEIIERLKKMNVSVIVVEGHPVKFENEKSVREKLVELEMRFSRVKHHPVLRAIMKIIAEHYIEEEKK